MSVEEALTTPPVREIECHGEPFASVAQLARRYGINAGTLVSRIQRGMSPEQAVSQPIQRYESSRRQIVYLIENEANGKKYVGITQGDIQTRLKAHLKAAALGRGGPGTLHEAMRDFPCDAFSINVIEHAANTEELSKLETHWIAKLQTLAPAGYNQNIGGAVSGGQTAVPVSAFGTNYPSIAEACRINGVDEGTYMNRISRGWSAEKALSEPATSFDKSDPVTVFGKTHPSLKAACKANGCRYRTVFHRVRYRGQDPEQAIKETRGKTLKVSVGGVEYKNLRIACEAHGMKYGTVIARMRRGLNAEEAILTPLKKN